ncbi:MAG: penicillin-binding protein activator LpoB [Treponema sp.]|nr:penicillin-binding protein activator LpoB [Treponema sp.]
MKNLFKTKGQTISCLTLIMGSFLLFSACGTSVNRVQPGDERDLSGYWNARDVRIVCEYLINDALSSPRVAEAIRDRGGRTPMVIVGRFRNESSEHINTAIISSTMETVIFNSGVLDFVAGGDTREDVRAERQDQQSWASEETVAALGREIGADFILTGSVRTIIERQGNLTNRTYFVTAELTDIETNARIWIGQHSDIVKVVRQPRNRI